MKASELIKALQEMIDKHGDHDVIHPCDSDGTGHIDPKIRFNEWSDHAVFQLLDADPI